MKSGRGRASIRGVKNVAIALGLVGLFAAAFAACSQAQPNTDVKYDDDMVYHPASAEPSASPTETPTATPTMTSHPMPESRAPRASDGRASG